MDKTFLVTGGAGFIGSNYVHHLLRTQDNVRVVNVDKLTYAGHLENLEDLVDEKRHVFVHADICDAAMMNELFEQYDPTYVVNFAAESHVDRSIESPGVFVDTNVVGTVTLLNAARKSWEVSDGTWKPGARFLQVSTDEVYGSLRLDDSDTYFTESTPLAPHSPYSASKASADLLVGAYATTYGMPVNITRCSNNYGPYQLPEKLIPLMIRTALRHDPLPVYGDGLNVRDWLFVEDHCKAIDRVLENGRLGEIYNVGGHNELSNIELVKTLLLQLGALTGDAAINESLITYVPDRKGHDRRYGIDPKKIGAELGWSPETDFATGLARTLEWYLANDAWVECVMKNVVSAR